MPTPSIFFPTDLTILFASDHAGFEMKNILRQHVAANGWTVLDLGPNIYSSDDDYPLLLQPAARQISKSPEKFIGIILGGSGQGEAMVANRFPHVRATVYYGHDLSIVTLGRQHNNSNVLSLGARFLTTDQAEEAVDLWLSTPFSGEERHVRRIAEIDAHRTNFQL